MLRLHLSIFCILLMLSISVNSQSVRRERKRPPVKDASNAVKKPDALFDETEYKGRMGWRLVTTSDLDSTGNRDHYYYDTARSTRTSLGVIRTWIRAITFDKSGARKDSSMDLKEYNCRTVQTRYIVRTRYSPTGQVTSTTTSESPWKFIPPETISEAIFGVLCRGERDSNERDMRRADLYYGFGQNYEALAVLYGVADQERLERLNSALEHYNTALEIVPGNQKLIAAMSRVNASIAAQRPTPGP